MQAVFRYVKGCHVEDGLDLYCRTLESRTTTSLVGTGKQILHLLRGGNFQLSEQYICELDLEVVNFVIFECASRHINVMVNF